MQKHVPIACLESLLYLPELGSVSRGFVWVMHSGKGAVRLRL